MPEMRYNELAPEYQAWIEDHVQESYGQCREVCAAMVKVFPELRRVYGTYYCAVWRLRNHFWCIDSANNVVDPTAEQFPSKGAGIYAMTRFYGLEFDKEQDLRQTLRAIEEDLEGLQMRRQRMIKQLDLVLRQKAIAEAAQAARVAATKSVSK